MKRIIMCMMLLTTIVFGQVEVSTRLQRVIQSSKSTEYVRGLILLRDQVNVNALDDKLTKEKASLEQRAYQVITALQEKARSTQGALLAYIEKKESERKIFSHQSFWIANMILIEAQPEVYRELMGSMELSQMDLDAELQYDRPVVVKMNTEQTETVEQGVKIINADKLWKLGITGQGRIVMNIDTGVEVNHPALSYKWRGTHVPASQAWFDPSGSTSPSDCDGHGTHTMGTMCGYASATGDTVGIAINAEWIAAKTICSSPHTSNSVAAFQWALNPDGNASTINDMPDVISNSWYDPDVTDECQGIYKTTLDALEAAGIAVVFSAGNNGPTASSITKPKNINTDEVNVFCVGNINGSLYVGGNNDPIESTSSRGPGACGGTGSLLIKPEVSAPGVNVRSSYPPSGYSSLTGTSMASPHVAGAIALLKSFVPTATGKRLKLALYNTARDLGVAGEDNNYGKGLIDVYAAYLTLGTPDTVPPTRVTDLAVAERMSNSLKFTWTAPSDTSPAGVVAYDIRRSATTITDTAAFNAATPVAFTGTPKPAGQTESVVVTGLQPAQTIYVALRAKDTWGNVSLISNVVSAATLAAPVLTVTPDSLKVVLLPATERQDSIKISNTSSSASTMTYQVTLENNTFPAGKVQVQLQPINNGNALEASTNTKGVKEATYGQSIEGQGGPD
ncbi:MAG: S8 family serine peptidase, partial [Ignavibacteria bacterium]|nr:S8 family serine peptidase [Ignavibacteria bacterium]